MGKTTTLPQFMEDAIIEAEKRGEITLTPMNKAAKELDKKTKKK